MGTVRRVRRQRSGAVAAALLLAGTVATPAWAEVPIGQTLTPGARQVAADGDWVIAADNDTGQDFGQVWMYRSTASGLTLHQELPVPDGYKHAGVDVAIDGDRAFATAAEPVICDGRASWIGHVLEYQYDGTTWTATADLVQDSAWSRYPCSRQATQLYVAADRLVVGGGYGVSTWELDGGGVWQRLGATRDTTISLTSGIRLHLTDDATTLAYARTDHLYLVPRSTSGWDTANTTTVPVPAELAGQSMTITGFGDRLVLGAQHYDDDRSAKVEGALYVVDLTNPTEPWQRIDNPGLYPVLRADYQFGFALAVTGSDVFTSSMIDEQGDFRIWQFSLEDGRLVETFNVDGNRLGELAWTNDLLVAAAPYYNLIELTSYPAPASTPADTVAPSVTGTPERPANDAGWYDAPVTIRWDVADPAPSSGMATTPPDTVADVEGSHTYTSDPACDTAGNCATGTLVVAVDTVVPTASVAVSPSPAAVGTSLTATGTVADDTSGVARAEWWLGDVAVPPGEATAVAAADGTVTVDLGALPVGVHQVNVRAVDAAGNWSATAVSYAVVYDPSGGFVTGAGHITPGGGSSDSGDVLPGLDGMSKANFGFVSRYEQGASTRPSGSMQFQYQAGDFRMKSTDYDWLVVTNSEWAKFQGLAEVRGAEGLWPFQVSARDGTTDRLVLKIWAPDADPDTDEPVYRASGDVEGGQVKIHR